MTPLCPSSNLHKVSPGAYCNFGHVYMTHKLDKRTRAKVKALSSYSGSRADRSILRYLLQKRKYTTCVVSVAATNNTGRHKHLSQHMLKQRLSLPPLLFLQCLMNTLCMLNNSCYSFLDALSQCVEIPLEVWLRGNEILVTWQRHLDLRLT